MLEPTFLHQKCSYSSGKSNLHCSYIPNRGGKSVNWRARITGSPKQEITHLWGEQVAQNLFHRRKIMNEQDFPLVYWEGMQKVMQSFPAMFRVWVTKHISHFNGTNRMLSRFPGTATRPKVHNRCPNCKRFDESTSHITDAEIRAVPKSSDPQWSHCGSGS